VSGREATLCPRGFPPSWLNWPPVFIGTNDVREGGKRGPPCRTLAPARGEARSGINSPPVRFVAADSAADPEREGPPVFGCRWNYLDAFHPRQAYRAEGVGFEELDDKSFVLRSAPEVLPATAVRAGLMTTLISVVAPAGKQRLMFTAWVGSRVGRFLSGKATAVERRRFPLKACVQIADGVT